ncbi:uncharacterized protein UTRI_10687 [Ustilago trichophora]|uniref:Uncharacterized protein n=1 Tax=Ustilago trichophora TaxID=86804 RepID=A0A5C3EA06_9BASI|nr:uncharacterized protein UTRI_10687 [Ustilago trichophora]
MPLLRNKKTLFLVALLAILGSANIASSAPLGPLEAFEEAAKDASSLASKAGSSASIDDLANEMAKLKPISAPSVETPGYGVVHPTRVFKYRRPEPVPAANKRGRAPETPRSSGSRAKQ